VLEGSGKNMEKTPQTPRHIERSSGFVWQAQGLVGGQIPWAFRFSLEMLLGMAIGFIYIYSNVHPKI